MALDLEEQEQLDELKAWWKRNGNKVIAAILVLAISFAGYRGWQWYQGKQTVEAAALFEVLRKEMAANDVKRIREVAGQLIDQYPRTVYATDAAMIAAKANFVSGDRKSAKAQYEWVIARAKQAQSKDLAHLRLAVVLVDEQAYDAALKQLARKPDPAFEALYLDLKGDILMLQGQVADARTSYQSALTHAQEGSFKQLVQLKLDALGEAK